MTQMLKKASSSNLLAIKDALRGIGIAGIKPRNAAEHQICIYAEDMAKAMKNLEKAGFIHLYKWTNDRFANIVITRPVYRIMLYEGDSSGRGSDLTFEGFNPEILKQDAEHKLSRIRERIAYVTYEVSLDNGESYQLVRNRCLTGGKDEELFNSPMCINKLKLIF